jgi:ABC-2 type transport system permease protein
VNWEHLKTYIWVRWRLSVNQVRRSGPIGAIIAAILAVLRILGGILAFIIGVLVGALALRNAEPRIVMVIWDGIAGGFLMFWLIGLLIELQRTDLLSLDNFMHLPVSPSGAFFINYIGSSMGLSLIVFLPAMIGFAIGLTLSRGIVMLILFPLIAAFFLMVTAVTYQFRGWLAGMMTNPRRRRTIIAVVTLAFILVFQIPNILNTLNPGARARQHAERETFNAFTSLRNELDSGQITRQEYEKRLAENWPAFEINRKRESERSYEMTRLVNMAAPPGWLPYGAFAAARGQILPALAAFAGMGLLGIISLRRSYRTTIRLYTGDFDSGRARRMKPKTVPVKSSKSATGTSAAAAFLEKKLPWVSEHASIISLMSFRSMTRAPEVKMLMLSPLIMLLVFGGMLAGKGGQSSILLRPLIALGVSMFMLIIGMSGFVGNQFAFDRSGFRAFVLSPAPRREILLGKNLALFPFALLLMAFVIGASQWLNPMRPDHFVAVLLQLIPIYLLFCLAGNLLSILSPITLKPGSGHPAPHQGARVFLQLVFILIVPVIIGLTLIPLGIEALFVAMKWTAGFPVFLLLGMVQAAMVCWLYRVVLARQGSLLGRREKKILEIVSAKGD